MACGGGKSLQSDAESSVFPQNTIDTANNSEVDSSPLNEVANDNKEDGVNSSQSNSEDSAPPQNSVDNEVSSSPLEPLVADSSESNTRGDVVPKDIVDDASNSESSPSLQPSDSSQTNNNNSSHSGNNSVLPDNTRVIEPRSKVYINEILAANVDTNFEPDHYKFSDWIELYNSSDESIDIGNYMMSDDPDSIDQWKIPANTIIAAHQYLLIWADKKDHDLHTNFKLSSKGEVVTLADKSGSVIDTIVFNDLKSDVSCAKEEGDIVFMNPTPGKRNSPYFKTLDRSKEPSFSLDEGFHTGTQFISLDQKNEGEIFYTVDGSTPTKKSIPYSQPIIVKTTTVIRAIAFENGKVKSKVRTKTYLISEESTLPVVSLAIKPSYLFDEQIGIYVGGSNGVAGSNCFEYADKNNPKNLKNYNQEWDRPVSIEYFDGSNNKAFDIGADLSISGQCSRYNKKKSFSLELGSKYGNKSLGYSLYSSKPDMDKIKDFKIRTGETPNDILSTLLVANGGFDVDYQAYQAIRMFVNGEYWGVYNIREKKGDEYLESNYPKLGKVDIIAHNMHGYVKKKGDFDDFDELFDYIKTHDLSIDENYQTLLGMIDEENYIDYMVLMIYAGNEDWLWNNNRWWKEKKEGAKWRWMLDDLDDAFVSAKFDTFDFILNSNKRHLFMAQLFKGLLANSEFKNKFKESFYEYLATTFEKGNVQALITITASERINYLAGGKFGPDQQEFEQRINKLHIFARDRVRFLKAQLDTL